MAKIFTKTIKQNACSRTKRTDTDIHEHVRFTGRSYGTTNLIVLDSSGNPIADTMVSVVQPTGDTITVFNGQARTTLSCNPICQQTITLGDDQGFTNGAYASSTLVQSAARPQ